MWVEQNPTPNGVGSGQGSVVQRLTSRRRKFSIYYCTIVLLQRMQPNFGKGHNDGNYDF